ncbi:hypothetical protein [Hathewaya massiliensis]|uniref:hypothetical protein n=1 Tax=Hathewaya massiliensis TaxID=1964382 RepID=UPI00115ABACB|nr:hypothetical protein [Hathewaya massiliensis]
MEKKYFCCNSDMVQAGLTIGSNSLLLQKETEGVKKFFSEYSKVKVYVCSNCGHVEFNAINPEIFKIK